jgi:glycosyltransferase involved in cell wall biosynthesis/GT2 family glycosyltransferase
MNAASTPIAEDSAADAGSHFGGRIIQLLDALDYGDAVSAHCLWLHRLLTRMGHRSLVLSKWYHEEVAKHRRDLDSVEVTDRDILILHFSGHSAHAWPHMAAQRCTKVLLYHNITPHAFFPQDSDLHDHCLKGRQQLVEVVRGCHFHWGVSAYNVAELREHGATEASSAVVPIVVDAMASEIPRAPEPRPAGGWLFVGRVAANKAHADIVRAFANVRRQVPELARELVFVGGYDEREATFRAAQAAITEAGLGDSVRFLGKVSDREVQQAYASASVYVSASRHEGFGVPLIEAVHHGVPVVALDSSAVGETLGAGPWLVPRVEELSGAVVRIGRDPALRQQVLKAQARNAERFMPDAVLQRLATALAAIVPEPERFRTVSIVICTYNRADLLDRCLDYLKYQTNRRFEVVVVNGPSDDGTDDVLERYRGQIKLAVNPQRNLSVSRNLGIELAAGDLIAFIDDDALPFDDWVDTLLREFNGRPLTTAGLGGPVYYAGSLEFQAQDIGINAFAESNTKIQSNEVGRNGWERSLLGTNTCFEAGALRAVRGFDEQFDYFLDESELCFRLQRSGRLVAYSPDLFLRHEFAQSHNRSGKFKYNWFTICKNTAYYVAAHSGLEGRKLEQYLAERMQQERIAPLDGAVAAGELPQADRDRFVAEIRRGVQQGLQDARHFPRTRELAKRPPPWKDFVAAAPAEGDPQAGDPLHVCLITKEFVPFTGAGGIGTLYYNLASELLLMGHRVTVLTPAEKDSVYQRGRFVLRYVRKRYVCEDTLGTPGFVNNLNWSSSALHALAALHAEQPVDVVDSALWDAEALATALVPRGKRPPLVVRLVTPLPVAARLNEWNVPEYEYSLYCAAERRLIEAADAVVPISDSIADTIEKEHQLKRDERWVRSHCGIAYWPFFESHLGYAELGEVNGQKLALPEGVPMVLFVGRLEGRKGVREMLAAAEGFLAAVPAAHLVLAGRDIDGFAAKAAAEMPAELLKRVRFLGQVDDPTREKLLHAAHCVIFPSRYESFGLVPLEAFVHGVPVVAARAGAIPEVVAEDECGLLFDPGDADDLAAAVQRLLTEPGLRERLSAGARRQIRRFSSRASALRAVALYRHLSAHSADAAP